MRPSAEVLNASQAARRLGVSPKALRLYEQRGLLAPGRTAAGWRAYGPEEMARAGEIATLRSLGLSLADVARGLGGDAHRLERALAVHQSALEANILALSDVLGRVRDLRADLAQRGAPGPSEVLRRPAPGRRLSVAFELPWPWGGEWFELMDIGPLNFITGPLGCGKTRLALRIAETLQGAVFLDLERAADAGAAAQMRLDRDEGLRSRVNQTLAWLLDAGGATSAALLALVVGLEAEGPEALVVDMVEQGLDPATQSALVSRLRSRGPGARPLFLMTRSSAVLDLDRAGADEAIIYCPANHSPPIRVLPRPGARGYEAVATCLATPAVRGRTEGMRARLPEVAWTQSPSCPSKDFDTPLAP